MVKSGKREKKFGETIRQLRSEQKIGLRELARNVGMSPAYLSKIERDEFAPPAEDLVKALAKALGQDTDELLALAGRVASDLPELIKRHPQEMASYLRAVKGLPRREIGELAKAVSKRPRGRRSRKAGKAKRKGKRH